MSEIVNRRSSGNRRQLRLPRRWIERRKWMLMQLASVQAINGPQFDLQLENIGVMEFHCVATWGMVFQWKFSISIMNLRKEPPMFALQMLWLCPIVSNSFNCLWFLAKIQSLNFIASFSKPQQAFEVQNSRNWSFWLFRDWPVNLPKKLLNSRVLNQLEIAWGSLRCRRMQIEQGREFSAKLRRESQFKPLYWGHRKSFGGSSLIL